MSNKQSTTTITVKGVEVSADEITKLRDDEQNSWAKVADALGIGSPGTARRAYTALVRPHTESRLKSGGGRNGSGLVPVLLNGLDLAGVRKAIVGKTISVQRQGDKVETIPVAKVTSVKNETVNFNDGSKSRSVKADKVLAAK
ncbi:hypothetical protein [Ilumatobacter coccineus]|nr:hypothetical protein [Ilumatobacter coccineus]